VICSVYLPAVIINKLLPDRLTYLNKVRLFLDNSLEIDASSREGFIRRLRGSQDYRSEADEQISAGFARHEELGQLPNLKYVPSTSPLATSEIAQKVGERSAYGK